MNDQNDVLDIKKKKMLFSYYVVKLVRLYLVEIEVDNVLDMIKGQKVNEKDAWDVPVHKVELVINKMSSKEDFTKQHWTIQSEALANWS